MAVQEARFIERALGDPASWWKESSLPTVSALSVPAGVLGGVRDLFLADIRLLWAQWFVESLGDPRRYAQVGANRPQIFADVRKAVSERFSSRTEEEQAQIASSVSDILLEIAMGLERTRRGRPKLPVEDKEELLDGAGSPPRCWLCGGVFAKSAVDSFLIGKRDGQIRPRPYVDILKPRGIRGRDLAIQVDHVLAFAQGGAEGGNLALACGWCNSAKSWYRWLYDADSQASRGRAGTFKGVELPKPFWTVRLLGAVRRCHEVGCTRSADNSEVTVAPLGGAEGVFNPLNLRVTCLKHDPYRSRRYQPRDEAARAWGVALPQ